MIAILSALAPLFLITAIGYALASLKFGGDEMWHALDHITFYLFFPALLVKTLMRADLGSGRRAISSLCPSARSRS